MPHQYQQQPAAKTAASSSTKESGSNTLVERVRTGDPNVIYNNAFYDNAFQPLTMPAPDTGPHDEREDFDVTNAPALDEVLNPARPDLSNAGDETVAASINALVDGIYGVFDRRLDDLRKQLEKTAPPAETPFALELIGWAVEQVASFALGHIGRLVADELMSSTRATSPSVSATVPQSSIKAMRRYSKASAGRADLVGHTATVPASASRPRDGIGKTIDTMAGKAGRNLGTAIETSSAPTTANTAAFADRAAPGESMLVEFITRQRSALAVRKVESRTTIAMVTESAARAGMLDLNEKLTSLLGAPALTGWFSHKVTMEWLNFVTRASLGPRPEGQNTNMSGANSVAGITTDAIAARQQWHNAPGFVDITLRTPSAFNGIGHVKLQGAHIPSSYAAAGILNSANRECDANGKPYSLATLPVFRRITIQTGDGKISAAPALILTPEGGIEADLTNPALAAIAAAAPVTVGDEGHVVGRVDEDMTTDTGAAKRMSDANAAMAGAIMIRDMLRGITTEVLT